ncbi:hypothetical protein [Hymenobacter latericus]|uniref:hypothetical protein n=1 Tax=Hymenobacter sp. YIM 151858-1 TaxID=2987688 RepID=UPI002226EB49|nr:hypothetical protein [Hymenobacter sp. YIM 151858-1]UYZ60839.1 hypothetical protein OIS50_08560 [Hymenobacter sp. YIM 151858-1]
MKLPLTLSAALLLGSLAAAPAMAQEPAKWQFYFEGGPKVSQFRTMAHSGSYSPQQGSNLYTEADRRVQVRNTFSAYAQAKAFKPLSERVVLAITGGLNMQHLNYRTGYTERVVNSMITSYDSEHISRLLTRASLDWGLYYRVKLGEAGQLMPGIAVGQMINLSRNGYSYTYLQPGVYYTSNRLLLSATVSDTPYNVLIPGASRFEGVLAGPYISETEYRIREIQVGIGARF